MTLTYWKTNISNVPDAGLLALAEDAERRIGSHVVGGSPNDEYVERQRALLELIQEELEVRSQRKVVYVP